MFARKALQAPRLFFRLLGEFALGTTASAPRLPAHPVAHRLCLPLQTLVLLLLPRRELTKPLERLVHFLRGTALRGLLLHGLVLVAHPIVLELEEVGEILGPLLGTAAAATATTLLLLLDLHILVQRVGTLQMAQRPLLVRQGGASVARPELLLSADHLLRRLDEHRLDRRHCGVALRHPALEEPVGKGFDVLVELPLRDRERRDVLVPCTFRPLGAVAHPVVSAGDDVALSLDEFTRLLFGAASAAASTSTGLGLSIVPLPGPHLDEIDVTEGLVAGRIARDGVVGDEVAGLEAEFFEQHRVGGLRLGRPLGRRDERYGLLLAAIHAITEFERTHAVVIARRRLDREFLDRSDLGVAPRFLDPHIGTAILEDFDGVLHAAGHTAAILGGEIDPVESVGREPEARPERPGRVGDEGKDATIVKGERAATHGA